MVSPLELAEDTLGFFRWGRIGGNVLVTNDAADWAVLTPAEFDDLLAGRVTAGHARFEELQRKGFVRDGLDVDALASRVALRNRHIRRGPHVHVLTVTARRGPAAVNGRDLADVDADMTTATAEQIVDFALQSNSPSLNFELQGADGEPLLNFDMVRHVVDVARTRNKRSTGKTLSFRVFSNFTAMTEEAAEWLIANDVMVTTSFDGPAAVHDANRTWKGGSAHTDVVRWIDYFNRRYAELGRHAEQWHVGALLTTTRQTLAAWREVIDEYVAHKLRAIHFQPLDHSRIDAAIWATIGYSFEEYTSVYRQALDYILELNRRGVAITERMASIFLTKILTSNDPGIVDIQSPHGAGTGEIAYSIDGRVFPSDDARLLDALGEPMFALGHVGTLTIPEVAQHPTVRAIAAASLLDAQPKCAECWNKPFCGFSPVRTYIAQGDLVGQRPHCLECKDHLSVASRCFELLADTDPKTAEILNSWASKRAGLASGERAWQDAP